MEYDISQIGNLYETPMFFDMSGNRTVDLKGNATVCVKTADGEKAHFTDGIKLQQAMVLNGIPC